MLGDPAARDGESWLEIGARESGVTIVSESFARARLPAAALASMRLQPCFYVCVENIHDAVAHVPGVRVGMEKLSHGMREICVSTADGMVVLAQVA